MHIPQIAVIVLNWNNAPDTIECLTSVYASQNVSFEVFVVDNGSTDHSLAQIKAAFPQATYIENQTNWGFAEGNNRGMRAAAQKDFPYFFLLNNDAVLREDTLSILQEAARQFPNAAAIGPKIYYYDSPTKIWQGKIDAIPELGTPLFRDADWEDEKVPKRGTELAAFICGCALFLRADIARTRGYFDPRYFLNWEEIDLCRKITDAGYDCLYVPQAKVWHKVSHSFIGGNGGPMWSYFSWRNRLLWMSIHCSKRQFFLGFAKVIWPAALQFARAAVSRDEKKKKAARAALRGIFHFICGKWGACPEDLFKEKEPIPPKSFSRF